MIAKMCKIQIIGLRKEKFDLISLLHKLGVLHIDFTPLSDFFEKKYNLKYVSLNEEEKKEQGILEEIIKK
jgi:vacuolar-type H+-ATPase subunit I/STV1